MISTVLLSSQPVSGLWYALGVGRLAYKRNARSLRHGFEVVQKLEGACEPSQSNRNSQGKGKTPRSEQKRIDLMERGGTACERGMTSKNLRRPREILFPALILRQRSEDAWKVPAVVVREKRRPAKPLLLLITALTSACTPYPCMTDMISVGSLSSTATMKKQPFGLRRSWKAEETGKNSCYRQEGIEPTFCFGGSEAKVSSPPGIKQSQASHPEPKQAFPPLPPNVLLERNVDRLAFVRLVDERRRSIQLGGVWAAWHGSIYLT